MIELTVHEFPVERNLLIFSTKMIVHVAVGSG